LATVEAQIHHRRAQFSPARDKMDGMRRIIVDTVMVAGTALALAGCGFADSRSPVPEFMRAKPAEPAPPEPPPDVKRMVREKLDSVFMAASYPRQIRVSPARRDLHGPGWTACVMAELNSSNGKPLGPQTYRITISGGVIMDRRRAEADDNCTSETFEPI
jgi:hypothetical protein